MKAAVIALVMLLATIAASAKADAASLPNCTDHGYAQAKEMNFAHADRATLVGLRISLNVDGTANDEQGPGQMCLRGIVRIGTDDYEYVGSNKTIPPRAFFNRRNIDELFKLSAIPTPAAAEQWERTTREGSWPNFGQAQLMYMFEVDTRAKGRSIYGFFDKVPSDAKIVQLLCDAHAGLLKPIVVTGPYPERNKPLKVAPSVPPSRHATCQARLLVQ